MSTKTQETPWGKKEAATPKVKDAIVPMYWIHYVDTTNPNPPTVFGKKAYKTDEGFFVVKVPTANVEGELGRLGKRLVTQEEYEQHLKEITPKA